MKKKKAFTLSEVLIVLAIIGVVAALTMPMLMNNYQKTQQIVALKKVYSQISDAVDRVMIDENAEKFTEVSLLNGDDADPKAFFKKYFRVSKFCAPDDSASCFPSVTSLDKSSTGNITNGDDCVVVKDGASICILPGDGNHWTNVIVDTNGLDKPNIGGRDVFYFSIYYDGSVDEINPDSKASKNAAEIREHRKDVCEGNAYGGGCLSRVIDAGWKMDY